MAKKTKSEDEVQEELRKSKQEVRRLAAENKALSEENDPDLEEDEDETEDEPGSHIPGISVLQGEDYETDILRERIAEKLKKKLGVDTLDNPLFNVIAEVSDKKTMEDKESLGNIFTDITLDEVDAESLQSRIGNLYGPGYYEVRVTNAGQMVTRFKWYLSPRKFKKPVDGTGPETRSSGGEMSPILEMMKMEKAQTEKRLEMAEQRNHEMMMKVMEGRKDMDLEKILVIADKMANKSNNGFDPMSLIMKVMDRSIDMGERAQEIKDGKSFVDYIGETLKDIVLPVITTYAKKAQPGAAQPVQVAYEPVKQVTPGTPAAEPVQTNASVLVGAGVIIGMVNDMFYGYAQDPTDPDDPDTYADRINVMGVHADFKKSILSMDNETLVTRLSTFSKDISEMFLDAKFKNYAILVFDGVRELNAAPQPVGVIEEKQEVPEPETK